MFSAAVAILVIPTRVGSRHGFPTLPITPPLGSSSLIWAHVEVPSLTLGLGFGTRGRCRLCSWCCATSAPRPPFAGRREGGDAGPCYSGRSAPWWRWCSSASTSSSPPLQVLLPHLCYGHHANSGIGLLITGNPPPSLSSLGPYSL
uniref:Uncharacterized protein n=1 Tax=Arundo donax TaxID=35708 RepID=A0A0A9EVF7_ARUDO